MDNQGAENAIALPPDRSCPQLILIDASGIIINKRDKTMDADELVLERQQQQLVKELGQLLEKENKQRDDQSSLKYAKQIAKKLSINYGSALSLIFWIEELLEIYPQDKKRINTSEGTQQRLIHLGRLIKVAGGEKGISFCCSLLPNYAVDNFTSLVDMSDGWRKKKCVIEEDD